MMRASKRRLTATLVAFAALVAGLAVAPSALAAPVPAWRIVAGSEPSAAVPASEVANEVQDATIGGTEGSWYLYKVASNEGWFPGTTEGEHHSRPFIGPMAYDATAAEVQAKIESSLGPGSAVVTGGEPEGKPYRIEFTGELAASEVKVEKIFALKKATGSIEQVSKGHGLTRLTATAMNVGAASTSGAATVSIPVPAGFVARKVASGEETLQRPGVQAGKPHPVTVPAACDVTGGTATCSLSNTLIPGDGIRMVLAGYMEAGAEHLQNAPTISGGGAAEAKAETSVPLGGKVPFGIEPGSLVFATSATAAGGHPNVTTGFTIDQQQIGRPAAYTRTVNLTLPRGLIGDPRVTRTCTMAEVNNETCPTEDAVGVATARIGTGEGGNTTAITALVYNVVPNKGEPAAFAFNATFPVRLDTHVGPEGSYHVEIHIHEVTEAELLLSSYVTLWGVPNEYTGSRPEEVEAVKLEGPLMDGGKQGFGVQRTGAALRPFLDYPTQCSEPETGELGLVSWPEYEEGGVLKSITSSPQPLDLPTPTECELEQFAPQVEVQTTTDTASQPAGYTVHLKVPQNESAGSPVTAEVRNVEVAMPEGTVISPSAANGLVSCSASQFALHAEGKGGCPGDSAIGKVKISTPLLAMPLEGRVYVGELACAPCTTTQAAAGQMVRLLLEAEGSGVTIKLEGYTEINSTTGRLTTVFEENPQLPFEELELSLKDGANAPLVNPSSCGNAITVANVTPWTSATATKLTAPAIPISGCATPGFTPSMQAGMTGTSDGGAFTPFSVTLSRPDGQQALKGVTIHTPPGLLGMLSKVQLCGEAQANAGTCPAASQIGTTSAVVGPGANPYEITGGKVYLTEHYGGGAFGLSIVVPAQAGPFHLAGQYGTGAEGDGNVVVRGSISVNPSTAALTIATNPMPEMLDGIPLGVDRVIVDINKAGFMFNPTSCNATSVTGTIGSWAGASANVSTPFQAHNCATLPFHPTFNVLSHAGHSRKNGAYLHVVVGSGSGQANIGKVDVELPKALSVRDETLKQSCPEAQYAANPAGCPAGSVVGNARAITPVLTKPLEGPAYFVSHAGKEFPNLDIVLQGEGVTIALTGNTYVDKKGYTFSKFETVPDAPISRFDLVLPEGPHSALAGNGNLCKHKLVMPTSITGQNGARIEKKTQLMVSGCGPQLFVRAKHAHGAKATIVLHVPYAGKLVANGKGISKVSKRIRKHGGRMAITVKLKRHFREQLRHSRRHHVNVTVHLRFSSHHHKAIKGQLKVRLK